ncbi:MAG: hypothetical protein AB8B56_00530 [Crocinitomicaceae bacterium]
MVFSIVSCRSYLEKELIRLNKNWDSSQEVVAEVCDTLILIDGCCCSREGNMFEYPHQGDYSFDSSVTCLGNSTNFGIYETERGIDTNIFIARINQEIVRGASSIKYIRIESPSMILFELDFSPLDSINTLDIWGNDFGFDAIKTIPKSLLEKPSFTTIINFGVRMPGQEIDSITKNCPKITIIADTILEYDERFDNSLYH